MPRDEESLLDEYWERLQRGEELEPSAWKGELGPLLKIAGRVKEAAAAPPPTFVEGLEERLLEKAKILRPRSEEAGFGARWKRGLLAFTSGRVRRVAVILAVVLALSGTGAVVAAQDSLPGDILYSVKRATEQLGLLVAPGSVRKADLHLEFTRRRTEEIERLGSKGQEIDEAILQDLAAETEGAMEEIEGAPQGRREGLLEKLVDLTERQQEVLQNLSEHVPPQAQPALLRAMEVSRRGHERAMQAIQKGRGEKPGSMPTPEVTSVPEPTPALEATPVPEPTPTPEKGGRPETPPGQKRGGETDPHPARGEDRGKDHQ